MMRRTLLVTAALLVSTAMPAAAYASTNAGFTTAELWANADAAGSSPVPSITRRGAAKVEAPPPATQRPDIGRGTGPAELVKPVLVREERPAGMSLRSWHRSQATATNANLGSIYVHAVWYEYNAWGHLVAVRDWETSEAYWAPLAVNVRGQVTQEILGNGVATNRLYHAVTGALLGVDSGQGTSSDVQQLTFEWDLAGNLKKRTDWVAGHDESFAYDSLYRLTQTAFTPIGTGAGSALTNTITYGKLGQIYNRDDAGAYAFTTPNNPYATSALINRPGGAASSYFEYDANGNMVSQRSATDDVQRSFIFGAGNRLKFATQVAGQTTTEFRYAPSGARYKQHKVKGGNTESTVYIGAVYERLVASVDSTTTTTHRLYVRVGDRVIAEEVITAEDRETRYWHRDHLGSVTAITTEAYNGGAFGEITTQGFYAVYSYGAWGEARAPVTALSTLANWGADPSYHRGFTGHEMLPDVGLIHMNGRVYMPETGTFLSPDSFIQFPESTQNYNRYSYVGNNPLSYTDPSGHFISILAGLVMKKLGWSLAQQVGGMFVAGFLQTGSIRGGIMTGIATLAAAGVGANFTGTGFAEGLKRAIAHGVTQGALSKAGGGRFGDGALGGFVGSAFGDIAGTGNGGKPTGNIVMDTIIAAIVGGTAAAAGGGKFANGAQSAAFVMMFNHYSDGPTAKRTPGDEVDIQSLSQSERADVIRGANQLREKFGSMTPEQYRASFSLDYGPGEVSPDRIADDQVLMDLSLVNINIRALSSGVNTAVQDTLETGAEIALTGAAGRAVKIVSRTGAAIVEGSIPLRGSTQIQAQPYRPNFQCVAQGCRLVW